MIFQKYKSKGFTLVELMVVVSIISLLASIILTSLSDARAKSRDSKRVQTMVSIRTAVELYRTAASTNDSYPDSIAVLKSTVMPNLVEDGTIFYFSPSQIASFRGTIIGCGNPTQVSYLIYTGTVERTIKLPLIYMGTSPVQGWYCLGTN